MASSLNNPQWLEWRNTLMGEGVSRQAYAATLPPDRFYCLLDELPVHLIPRRSGRSIWSRPEDRRSRLHLRLRPRLRLNPECIVCEAGQLPDELASRKDLL